MFKKLKNQKGFTVVENILASIILSVGLLSGLMAMSNATSHTLRGDMNTVATQLANEKIEQILADKSFVNYEYLSTGNYQDEILSDAYYMQRSVVITEVNTDDLSTPEEGSGMKKVAVTVSWGNGAAEEVVVSTLISDYQ